MSLEKCPECGGQVSTKARACPHCGAPRMPHAMLAFAIVTLVALVGAGVALFMATPRH